MKRRIRIAAASLMVAAGLTAAVAAPASADQPFAHYAVTCTIGGAPFSASGTASVGGAHKVVAFFRREVCDRGTLEYTITRL